MKNIIPQLREFLDLTRKNLMSDEEFFAFLDHNPKLYSLMSSALREASIQEGNVIINGPALLSEDVEKKAFGEVISTLKNFARWLHTASRKYKLPLHVNPSAQVPAETVVATPSPTPARQKTQTPSTELVSSGERAPNLESICRSVEAIFPKNPILEAVCAKLGGTRKLRNFLEQTYAATPSQKRVAAAVKRATRIKVGQRQVSNWMREFHLLCLPAVGGRRLKLLKGPRRADKALRKKFNRTLAQYVREWHAQNWTSGAMAREVDRLTGVNLKPESIRRIRIRLRLVKPQRRTKR